MIEVVGICRLQTQPLNKVRTATKFFAQLKLAALKKLTDLEIMSAVDF
jgi:hypothetical protein